MEPYNAVVTDGIGEVIQFVQIGCSAERQSCCPYLFQEDVVLNRCPLDYTAQQLGSYRACCPSLV